MITSLSDRESYPCLEKFTYLNQASLGLISSECIKEMTNFLNQTARFGNIHISDEDELDIVDKLRNTASKLLGCPSNQTAVLSSASEILNQIPYIIKPSKKSEILLLKNDFPAVTRPWLKYAKEQSCSINFIEENLKSDITDEVLKNITSKTSVIAISLIQYSTGTKINLDILSKEAKSKGIEHSKIPKLKEILNSVPGKALIFTSYRDSVDMIHAELQKMNIPAGILIGKAGDTGLKQKKQIEVVQKFRDGEFKVLVATRVGEEGLDIAEVNQVIFYDNVPSSIRFIQRRGRTGRKDTGKLVVLIAKNTIDETYYWIGKRKISAAKSMGSKMTKVLEKNKDPSIKTGLDAFL